MCTSPRRRQGTIRQVPLPLSSRPGKYALLWLQVAEWASVWVYERSADEAAAVEEVETCLVCSRMRAHADVEFDKPDPSPLRVDFRPPEVWPPGLTQGSFAPSERQWRGEVHPYQSIEYTVHGFPIALYEQGLSAYVFYAGAKYERNGKFSITSITCELRPRPALRKASSSLSSAENRSTLRELSSSPPEARMIVLFAFTAYRASREVEYRDAGPRGKCYRASGEAIPGFGGSPESLITQVMVTRTPVLDARAKALVTGDQR